MKPKVIKSDKEYKAALARIEALMIADVKPDSRLGDELELLATLVEIYEEASAPVPPPDPIEAIKFRMEQAGLKQRDLARYIGSKSKVSEVLSGKRALSLRMIRGLHANLDIPADVLLKKTSHAIR